MSADHLLPATSETPTDPLFEIELRVHKGVAAGDVRVLRRFPAIVGRSREVDVCLGDDPASPTLSRRHISVAFTALGVTVTDLSTNGTWVGTRRLTPGETALLAEGEPVWLGPRTMLTLRPLRPGPPPAPVFADEAPTGAAEGCPPQEAATPIVSTALHAACPQAPGVVAPAPGDATRIPVVIRALGRFQVTVDGATVADAAWATRKAMMVLAWLAESPERGVAADRLEEALWPDAAEGARQALHTAVSRIRRAFRTLPGGAALPVPLLYERSAYLLNPAYGIQYDVVMFQAHCAHAQRFSGLGRLREAAQEMERALGIYGGPFIEGPSDDWLESRRRALQGRRQEVAETLAALWAEEGRLGEALDLYQGILEADPCREPSQVGLVRVLLAAGRREDAIRQYQASVRALRKILNLPPSEGLVALYESAMRS